MPAHAGFMGGTDECDTCTRAHPRRSLRPRAVGQASEGRGRPAPLTMNAAGLRGARPAAPCPRASGAQAGPRAAAPARRAGAAGRSIARRCGAADLRTRFRRVRPGWWGPGHWGRGAQAGRARAPPGPASWGGWHGALRAPDMRVQGTLSPSHPDLTAHTRNCSCTLSRDIAGAWTLSGDAASTQPPARLLCGTF